MNRNFRVIARPAPFVGRSNLFSGEEIAHLHRTCGALQVRVSSGLDTPEKHGLPFNRFRARLDPPGNDTLGGIS